MGKRKSKSNPQPEQKPSSGGPKDLWFDEDPLDDSRFDKHLCAPLKEREIADPVPPDPSNKSAADPNLKRSRRSLGSNAHQARESETESELSSNPDDSDRNSISEPDDALDGDFDAGDLSNDEEEDDMDVDARSLSEGDSNPEPSTPQGAKALPKGVMSKLMTQQRFGNDKYAQHINERVQGGRIPFPKKVNADLDSEDEIIRSMKEKGYADKAIAQRLKDENRVAYREKSITTRYARIMRALHEHETKKLDDEVSDWHEGDDARLDSAMANNNMMWESELAKLKKQYWSLVAKSLKEKMDKPRFSHNSCRERWEAHQAGTALKELELDSDQEGRAAIRIQRVKSQKEKRALEQQQAEQAAEAYERSKAEKEKFLAERAGRVFKNTLKRNEKQRAEQEKKDSVEAKRRRKLQEEADRKAAKKHARDEKRRQRAIKRQSKKQRKLDREAQKEQERVNRRAAELQAQLDRQEAVKAKTKAKLQELQTHATDKQVVNDVMAAALSRAMGGAAVNGSDGMDVGSPSTPRTGRDTTGHAPFPAPVDFFSNAPSPKSYEGTVPAKKADDEADEVTKTLRLALTGEQIRDLAASTFGATISGTKEEMLDELASAEKRISRVQLVDIAKKRGVAWSGSKAEIRIKLARDEAGLLGFYGTDFHEKLLAGAKPSEITPRKRRDLKRCSDANTLDGGSSKKIKQSHAHQEQNVNDASPQSHVNGPNGSTSAPNGAHVGDAGAPAHEGADGVPDTAG